MSFTENLYLRKQLQKLQEENLKLRQILEQASPRPLSERPRPTPGPKF